MTSLFRRLFQVERHKSLLVLIDATETMERRSAESDLRKFDCARKLAAAVGVVGRSRYDSVEIAALGHARGKRSPVLRHDSVSAEPIYHYLDHLRPGGKPRFMHILQRYSRRASRSTSCVVFSDFLDPEWDLGIGLLLNNRRLHTSLVQILDSAETMPALLREFSLVDPDDGSTRPLGMDSILLPDLADGISASEEIAEQCRLVGADYIRTTTDQPFEAALIDALESR